METLGNAGLLDGRKIGFFASSNIASLSVLPTLDWASAVAKRDDVAVMSGFHSKMEREVLDILLNGRCGIICVLTRPAYKVIPHDFRNAFAQGRVLFISHNTGKTTMPSIYSCKKRNVYIASISDSLVFSSLTPASSLYPLSLTDKDVVKL